MNNPNDEPVNETAEAPAVEPTEKKTLEQQLEDEMKKWRGELDELKVQVHLGTMDAQDKMQPCIDQLEEELAKAKKDWQEFGEASEGAWQELGKGLKLSLAAVKQSAEKAKAHFEPKKD